MTNPELDQDRAFDLYDTYRKYGYVMFPQQRRIYEQLAQRVAGKTVLEVGCGNGVGTAMLAQTAKSVVGTDKLGCNVHFASELYPWIDFSEWDVQKPRQCVPVQCVVAVEIIEHVADPVATLRNMFAIATEELWISTPNGKHSKHPPENPHHVREYTVNEMIGLIRDAATGCVEVNIHGWEDLSKNVELDTDITPLVYEVRL